MDIEQLPTFQKDLTAYIRQFEALGEKYKRSNIFKKLWLLHKMHNLTTGFKEKYNLGKE